MLRILVCAMLLGGLMAQQPPPRHDKYASDPKAYCMPAKPADEHGHECHCKFMCSPTINHGEVEQVQVENPACELYCTMERCACHSEETCSDR